MSYAWQQLQNAVRTLALPSDRRERLACAYGKLIKLKPKDLPSEVVDDFSRLFGRISRYPAKKLTQEIKTEVRALSDAEVTAAIERIFAMHDALAVYQPRPICLGAGMRRANPSADWMAPAMHGANPRKASFESTRAM